MILAFALAFSGLAALCLAMDRHHAQALRQPCPSTLRRRGLSGAGWLLLASGLGWLAVRQGWPMAVTLWLGLLMAAGMALVLLLSYAPRLAPAACPALLLAGLAAMLL